MIQASDRVPSGLLPELDQDSPEGLHIPSGLGAQMSGTKWRDGHSIPVSVAMTDSYYRLRCTSPPSGSFLAAPPG